MLDREENEMRARLTHIVLSLLLATEAAGQADFVNFETPQVKPIDVIENVLGYSWVVACNTPDNSIEIYRVEDGTMPVGGSPPNELSFQFRVPTGLGPVTVRYVPDLPAGFGSIYVANYIGDSITRIEFPSDDGAGNAVAIPRLKVTRSVGDSPTDFALDPFTTQLNFDLQRLQVLLSAPSELVFVNAATLVPDTGLGPLPVIDARPPYDRMKEPRRMLYGNGANAQRAAFLNFRGGSGFDPLGTANSRTLDFDLLVIDAAAAASPGLRFDKLGSTNASMAISQANDIYVVGSHARNDVTDKVNLRSPQRAPTGFVESWIFRVDGTTGYVTRRDLNRDSAGAPGAANPVSMPMDVVVRELNGQTQLYVASFQSDRIVVLAGANIASAARTFLVPSPPRPGYSQTGPRGLALKEAQAMASIDPGARLYSLNRLDNSISVFDPNAPNTGELAKVALQSDPTPAPIRMGRRFLYDAVGTSGNGMVACGSCHIDARTDGLAWKLDGASDPPIPMPIGPAGLPPLLDSVRDNRWARDTPWTFPNGLMWPGDRMLKVTQSLQGLLNHPVGSEAASAFTNAPYHWRGDKSTFLAFNEAFVNLQGMASQPGAAATGPNAAGLSAADMNTYEAFINTIVYPPNPEQDVSRRFRQNDVNALATNGSTAWQATTDGSNPENGLRLFHERPLNQPGTESHVQAGGRSCVHCHSLPEGSNNRITVRDNTGGGGLRQPLETAALRGLFAREGFFVSDNSIALPPIDNGDLFPNSNATGGGFSASAAGLLQGGSGGQSINSFMARIFLPPSYAAGQGTQCPTCASVGDVRDIEDITGFVREFDWGIAPIIGRTRTYTANSNVAQARNELSLFAERESRQANCDVVVFRDIEAPNNVWTLTGYYYDVASDLYVDPLGTGTLSLWQVLPENLGRNDVVITMAAPLGSGRRIADVSPTSGPLPPVGGPPTNVDFLSAIAPEPWEAIATFTGSSSLNPADGAPAYIPWEGVGRVLAPAAGPTPGPSPGTLSALYGLQQAVLQQLPGLAPSLTGPRHEPPRRFRVSGDGIQYGARLRIAIPLSPPRPPGIGNPPSSWPAVETQTIELPLFARENETTGGTEWVTDAAIDSFWIYILLNGGPYAPGVGSLFEGDIGPSAWVTAFGQLDPRRWNSYFVQVVNPPYGSGDTSAGSWERYSLP